MGSVSSSPDFFSATAAPAGRWHCPGSSRGWQACSTTFAGWWLCWLCGRPVGCKTFDDDHCADREKTTPCSSDRCEEVIWTPPILNLQPPPQATRRKSAPKGVRTISRRTREQEFVSESVPTKPTEEDGDFYAATLGPLFRRAWHDGSLPSHSTWYLLTRNIIIVLAWPCILLC